MSCFYFDLWRSCTAGTDAAAPCFNQNNARTHATLTLQRVKDGEQVHEGQADGPPGKQSKAPRHSQEEGEADDAPQIPQHLSAG